MTIDAKTGAQSAPPETGAPLAAGERCDRCSAAGKLRVRLAEGGDLIFCDHHANKYADHLVKIAVEVAVVPDFIWRGTEL